MAPFHFSFILYKNGYIIPYFSFISDITLYKLKK